MHGYFSYKSRDEEKRKLRIHLNLLERSLLTQKKNNTVLHDENTVLKRENDRLKREKQKLKEELEKIKRERDAYKGMVFKEKRVCSNPALHKSSGLKTGGQAGHKGVSRTKPNHVHQRIRAFLTNCPNCHNPLLRTSAVTTHTVTDLPHWERMEPVITEYSIERQWCPNCHKEVQAQPLGVIPGSRLGPNLVTMILVWKYRFREPLNKIAERLLTHYNFPVSESGLTRILFKARVLLGPNYEKLIKKIRGSPVKYADETGWLVSGEDFWAWVFTTKKETVYIIEESRGGGIARSFLEGSKGVLVRDDYKAYTSLSMPQQSCWTHLLRTGHNLSHYEDATPEVKKLHRQLKNLFDLLSEDVKLPFNLKEREEFYEDYKKDLQKIIDAEFKSTDTKKLQTRVRNQNTNLLTALLYEGVDLTNNEAERSVMPLVIQRKISRGSKSTNGAKNHAVNMSIIETIIKRKQPLLNTLQKYLLKAATGKR